MREIAYRAACASYRRMRRLKHRTLNLVDPPVVVLGYHRVAAKAFDPHLIAVSPENFRAQMHHLKRTCRLLRFEENWSATKEPAVAVTFDDGYADNLLQALPILEEVGIPAIFFISTFILDQPRDRQRHDFWWDELELLVLGECAYPVCFRLKDREHGGTWPTETGDERRILYHTLHHLFLKSRAAQREDWLQQLRIWANRTNGGREADRLLTPEELRLLAASPWATVGAHTVTHTSLAALAEEEQRWEITASKQHLEELLGRPVTFFAYPYGASEHFNRATTRLCREAGFARAVSTLPGQAHRWTDPWRLPRQLVRNWDLETFAARLESFWT